MARERPPAKARPDRTVRRRQRHPDDPVELSGPGGPQGGPGESGPGEPGYHGRVTLGEEGAAVDQGEPVRRRDTR